MESTEARNPGERTAPGAPPRPGARRRPRGGPWRALGLALLLALAAYLAIPTVPVLREPYLQAGTPSSMTIVWRTERGASRQSLVRYGTRLDDLSQTATGSATPPASNPRALDHVVTLEGLAPETRYFYAVGSPGGRLAGGGPEHHFTTSPEPGTRRRFTACVFGDSGSGSEEQRAVRDAIRGLAPDEAPDLFLHMGDVAYRDGTDSQYTIRHFSVYAELLRRTPFWPTLGNHDARSADSATQTGPYFEAFVLPRGGEAGGLPSGTEAYYAFDYANVHFVSLDSIESPRGRDEPMLRWLREDLASTRQDWVVAYFHYAPYTKGSHDSDDPADSEGNLVEIRERVLPVLEAGGVDLVLSGHSHSYERSYLIDRVYGFGSPPAFATPDRATLLAAGRIVDAGDGRPNGDGPYVKRAGLRGNAGTVYLVAGHGGRTRPGSGLHPVMHAMDVAAGFVLLTFDGDRLSGRNVRFDGAVTDQFDLVKSPAAPQTASRNASPVSEAR
jgi:hypothetical protein